MLSVLKNCEKAIYVPEDPPAQWLDAVGVKGVAADAVATPRGIVKFSDMCNCTVSCDPGENYAVECICPSFAGGPTVLPNDAKDFPNPKNKPYNFDWVGLGEPYGKPKHSTDASTNTTGFWYD
jgi:hypothetical protein